MTEHVLLDNITHKDLRIERRFCVGSGFDHHLARVFPSEFGILQAEYPLFMIKNQSSGHYDFVALLGFEPDENLYLGDGQWLARTLPMTIERQPFLIGQNAAEGGATSGSSPVIFVDLEHPAVNWEKGEPVFLPHGGESAMLEDVGRILGSIHEGHGISEALSRTLSGLDLVESLNLEVTLDNGQQHALEGLYTINEERLNGLGSDTLGVLHEKGDLQRIFMLLASMPQLATLIERKNAKIAEGRGK